MDKKMNDKSKVNLNKLISKRSLKYGSNSLILIVIAITMAIVVNLIVGLVPAKLDLTPEKLYSIGDTSKELLGKLEKDVVIYGLFDEAKALNYKEATELLKQYEKYDHVKVVYVDPDKDTTIINKLDPDNVKQIAQGNFVVTSGKKIKKLDYTYDMQDQQMDESSYQTYTTGSKVEQALTGAVKFVTADKTPIVYFLQGHDEKQPTVEYTTVMEYLDKNNYEVKTLNLVTEAKVPDDAAFVVVAAPKKDLTASEKYKFAEYLKLGGKGVFLFDVLDTDVKFTQFEEVLKEYNVSLNYDRVKENDTTRFIPNRPTDIVPILTNASMNSYLDPSTFGMLMPKARSLNILKNPKELLTVESLMKTSAKAVGEQVDKTRGADLQGPLDLAISVEYKGGIKPVKLLVMGNATFMTDSSIQAYQSNGLYFFLNSLMWMQDEKEDLIVPAKQYSTQSLDITAEQANMTGIFVVIILPLLILGTAFYVFLRRRHL